MYELKSYEILMRAETPIAHHQETFGNHAMVFRRKVRQPDGSWADVPYITGDSLRHGLREAAAYVFLDAAGLLDQADLTEAALRLIFNGGMVSGRGDASNIKLDHYREMVDLMPHLALLGGCASNRVIPGRINVEDAVLVCAESVGIVPEWMVGRVGALDSGRSHIEEVQRVRMDSTLDPGKRRLLSASAAGEVSNRLLASEDAAGRDESIAIADAKSSMMPRTFETVAAGSMFSWRIVATCMSDLDVDTLHTMLGAFLSSARVGGKRGTGHGRISAVEGRGVVVNRPAENVYSIDTTALAPKVGDLFRAHVRARADKIKPFLQSVDA